MSESEQNPGEVEQYERHRALVRETDRKFATVYGAGGAAVLGAGALVLVLAWVFGMIGSILPWVLAPTTALVSLFVLNGVVRRQRATLKAKVLQYCEVNDLDWQALRDYYEGEGLYPYFLSLFRELNPPRPS